MHNLESYFLNQDLHFNKISQVFHIDFKVQGTLV